MIQPLPYDEIEMRHGHPDLYMNKYKELLDTPNDSDIGYFVEVDSKYTDEKKEKTKVFPIAPENEVVPKDKYNDYLKKIQLRNYAKAKKLICDWCDKKNYLIHFRMLKFYVRHGMIIDNVHEIISFKQNKWLERHRNFITQKRNKAENEFQKDFFNLLIRAFYGKTMKNVRYRLRLKFFKKDDIKSIIEQQSKLTFNGVHQSVI